MEISKLYPILNKESILKTANAAELGQAPHDVLQRYQTYALTHMPLGDTDKQVANLQRVIVDNKTCAVGTIVGPYGYGKTSTAVHLWDELREKRILSVPPFLWVNLQELVTAVYHWARFEFEQGPAKYVEPLDELYQKYVGEGLEQFTDGMDIEYAKRLYEEGRLNVDLRPEDVVEFYSAVDELARQAGYRGLAVFTDELQATVAAYRPSRDQFFKDFFGVVKDTLGHPGNWALISSMDDGTEAIISRERNDLLQRMQQSALYFRVEAVYNRREYPTELWAAFEKRFGFDGSEIILPETLASIGQIASRKDLGAGPRMVTFALSLAVKHYEKHLTLYTPLDFVNDFVDGLIVFDQRGKFPAAVKKALDNNEVRDNEVNQNVVKLLAGYPAGCPEEVLKRFELADAFQNFPPLARRELIVQLSEGHSLRYLLEEERPPDHIEQRLTQEFAARFAPSPTYAAMAASGFLDHILLEQTFARDFKAGPPAVKRRGDEKYVVRELVGTFDKRYPQRKVTLAVAAMSQSKAPNWEQLDPESDLEIRFEMNYGLSASEPSQLLVAADRPSVAIFQLNLNAVDDKAARATLPDMLFDYYSGERVTPLLALALTKYMFEHSGNSNEDVNRVKSFANFFRQYALTLLLGQTLQVGSEEFASSMVGHDRITELFKTQCQLLFPSYQTLMTGKGWKENLQQYGYALERVVSDEGVSVARGTRSWESTKEGVADAFRIPKLSLTRLETLLDALSALIIQEDYAGRSPDSPVRLRFALHPLEKQWLDELDASEEKSQYNGLEAPALYAVELLRRAQQLGYRMEELEQVLALLQSRQFVAYDQRQGLLIRAVDAVDDLKAAVTEQLEKLEQSVNQLEESVPDFDPTRTPVRDLQQRLEEAKARDELEILKNDIRQQMAGVMSFTRSKLAQRRNQYQTTLQELQHAVQVGVPPWLGQPFSPSPLQTPLEKYRQNVVGAYESTLRDMRALAMQGNTFLKELVDSPVESLIELQKALPGLNQDAEKLRTRLRSYEDQQSDLIAWRQAVRRASEFERQAQEVSAKYDNEQWRQAAKDLWKAQEEQMAANALNIPTLHRDVNASLDELETQLESWLANRREDFEDQRERYEDAFASLGLTAQLRIPFDQQNPSDSYAALVETVKQIVERNLHELERDLNQTIQRLRYAEHVQQADVGDAIIEGSIALGECDELASELSSELLRDVDEATLDVLDPLQALVRKEEELAGIARNALKKRELSPDEAKFHQQIQSIAGNGDVDLYSLIIRQLHEDEEAVELDELLDRLQTLFQKNQIGIRIRLL